MQAREYILSRQIQWAHNRGVTLVGSAGERGRHIYTHNFDDNFFAALLPATRAAFETGTGGELVSKPPNQPKMAALHSSSALGVNIFQYWQSINAIDKIASACGFCRKTTQVSADIMFEAKYPIDDDFRYPPNLDVVICNNESAPYKAFAIECKFTEAYGGRGHSGLKQAYLDLNIWQDVPNVHQLATVISPKDDQFQHLHAAQLIKHILGLKKAYGKTKFRLLYLWYDALGEEGARHRAEISAFADVAKSDGIKFHGMSYQKLIVNLAKHYRETHPAYIEYITDRYL